MPETGNRLCRGKLGRTKNQTCESASGGARRPGRGKRNCKPGSVQGRRRVYGQAFFPATGLCAVIHLALPLPGGSSGQPGDWPDACVPLFGLAPDGVCPDPGRYRPGGELLPRHFTLTWTSRWTLHQGGMFLWHFPSGRPAPLLTGILPGGARTFLPPGPKDSDRDGGRPSHLPYAMLPRLPVSRPPAWHSRSSRRSKAVRSGPYGTRAPTDQCARSHDRRAMRSRCAVQSHARSGATGTRRQM